MKLPRMDTFRLPISPSHVATTSGIALSAALPGITGNVRDICVAGIIGAYILGETIYASVNKGKVEVPVTVSEATNSEIAAIHARLKELGG